VHTEGAFAKWHVDDINDGIGDCGDIRLRWHGRCSSPVRVQERFTGG
jgi:hypothetical protein